MDALGNKVFSQDFFSSILTKEELSQVRQSSHSTFGYTTLIFQKIMEKQQEAKRERAELEELYGPLPEDAQSESIKRMEVIIQDHESEVKKFQDMISRLATTLSSGKLLRPMENPQTQEKEMLEKMHNKILKNTKKSSSN